MGRGTLTIYSASAGSGKTFKLTGIYLSKLFRSKSAFKKILAVTFTNKAASDMKRKILTRLYEIASGNETDLTEYLVETTGKSRDDLAAEGKEILEMILHDYSGFFVGTIDSFFQRILKAFTREIGLQYGYSIELDHSGILKDAVNETLAGAESSNDMSGWLIEYARDRLDEGKSWNLKDDILALGEEIFKEKFKLLTEEERLKLRDREFLKNYLEELKSVRTAFEKRLSEYAGRCLEILELHGVDDDMFLRGNRGGVPSFLSVMRNGVAGAWKPPNATVSQVLQDPPVWTSKAGVAPQLSAALDDGFGSLFIEAFNYYLQYYRDANTSSLISANIYVLGILSDILDQVHKITTSDNRFLLSDSGEFLYLIIGNDQAPFIYEKTGNRFEHFMIDEFQDTSLIQWNNFRPLIDNSMAEGNDNLVVGDVKQSIYRWRNSDWRIFGSLLAQQADNDRIMLESLKTNWRSRKNIVEFNNSLFSKLTRHLDSSGDFIPEEHFLDNLYSDARQLVPPHRDGGMVRIEFVDDSEETAFEDYVLEKLPGIIENLQDKGYSGSDIGILVRTNSEGAKVLNCLLEYQMSVEESKKTRYNYNIISNESLLLSNSPAVNFIVTYLASLHNPADNLNRALLLKFWLQGTGNEMKIYPFNELDTESEKYFPPGFRNFPGKIRQMPLLESVESIIKFFRLGEFPENSAYLNTLQDYILQLSGNQSADISVFLDWWSTEGIRKSIVLSDQEDTMRVMTIHKSKGLEFRTVIIPFITWDFGHGRKNPTLWVRPGADPFNKIGLVPVKYKSDLMHSHFETDYNNETVSAVVDNLNLLYVAFTRAVDCLFAFCPAKSPKGSVASVLYSVFTDDTQGIQGITDVNFSSGFNRERSILLYGKIESNVSAIREIRESTVQSGGYFVNLDIRRLHLKLHGQNWLIESEGNRRSINYGLLMHELFQSVITPDDIPQAVNSLVLKGKIPESARAEMEERVLRIIENPEVSDWFRPGLTVMNERDILTHDGAVRRPDRVMIEGDRATIVDLKFGIEKDEYLQQVDNYRQLLLQMGYRSVTACLWFVDKNKVVKV